MVSTLRELNERGVVRTHRRAMVPVATIPGWRWLALIAVVVAVLHDRLTGIGALAELFERNSAALLPIASVFELWSLILVGFLGYAVFQLAEDQRYVSVYDLVSRHVVAFALLSSFSIVALPYDNIYMTAGISVAMAVVAGAAYVRVQTEINAERSPRWIGALFALGLGFSITMAVTATDTAITAAGCPSSAPAIIACIGLTAFAIHYCLRFRDAVLPGLVGWSLIAICAANRASTELAGTALLGGTACAASAIVMIGARLSYRPQPARR